MPTTTATDWYCRCGTFNKAAWSVCPVCESRREDLAGPSAAQLAERRREAAASVRRTTSSAYYGVIGAVIALAVLAGLAFGGWKAWGYAQDRWFDKDDDRAVAAKPLTDQQLLAKHIVAPGAPFVSRPVPQRLQMKDAFSPAEQKKLGFRAGLSKLWRDPATKREALTVVVEFDSSRIPASKVQQVAKSFFDVPTRRFDTPLPDSVGLTATKKDGDGQYVTAVTILRGPRLAWVGLATVRPPTADDIAAVKELASKQYSHL